MASLRTVRDALAAAITASVDIQGYANVPEAVNLPAFVVMPRTGDFMVAMGRGGVTYTFDVFVLVSRRDDDLAQYDLDDYIEPVGSQSVSAAIWDARDSLAAQGMDVHVRGWSQYGARWDIGDIAHVGAALEVQVLTNPNA